jgi:hypothetical protein
MHVVPIADLRDHPTDTPTTCPCRPVFDFVDGGGLIVVHNAWDKRELREHKATAS